MTEYRRSNSNVNTSVSVKALCVRVATFFVDKAHENRIARCRVRRAECIFCHCCGVSASSCVTAATVVVGARSRYESERRKSGNHETTRTRRIQFAHYFPICLSTVSLVAPPDALIVTHFRMTGDTPV